MNTISVHGKDIDISQEMPQVIAWAAAAAEAHYNGDGTGQDVARWGRLRWKQLGPTLQEIWVNLAKEKLAERVRAITPVPPKPDTSPLFAQHAH